MTTGRVDWRRTAVDTAIGGIAGLAGGGAGAGVTAATAGRASVSCLGRNMLVGAAGGMADGGVSSGLSYLTGPGPHTAGGMAEATGAGAGLGAVTGAGTGAIAKLTGVSSIACFVAGTPVVMADGTTTPIEQVKAGDRVQAWNPDSGRFESRQVADTYAHQHVATWRITTSDGGQIVSTGEHPFHVQDRGWTPVNQLQPGDLLHGHHGATVTVQSVGSTGATATVHNFHIAGLHTYQITTSNNTPAVVHNSCTPTQAKLAEQHINPNSDTTVLGLNPGYKAVAIKKNASYFDIGDKWDELMSKGGDPWELNTHFLDTRIAAHDKVTMSISKSEVEQLDADRYTSREVAYLKDTDISGSTSGHSDLGDSSAEDT